MSDIFNECNVHPHEEASFKSAVLRTLIARHTLASLSPDTTLADITAPMQLITALGVDVAGSELVNDCAGRIADGSCRKFTVQTHGHAVIVESRSHHE